MSVSRRPFSLAKRFNIVCVGDSLTEGYPSFSPSYPSALAALRPLDTVVNAGHTGAHWSYIASDEIPTFVAGHFVASKKNVVLLLCGINDITETGDSAATVLAAAASNIATIKSYGFTVVVSTMLPAGAPESSYNSVIATYNAGLLSVGADYVLDNASDTYFNPANGSVYADSLHLTGAGYTHLAANWHGALNALAANVPTPSASEVVVSWATTQQTMDGFGATLNNFDWGSGTLALSDADADAIFDPTLGIGLSLIRVGISPEASTAWFNASDVTKGAARGARFFGDPWSPPGSYKSGGTELGGSLNSGSYTAWANDLAAFPAAFKTATGVDLYALKMQNEPDFTSSYETCSYSDSQQVAFAKVLGPKLAALTPPVKMVVGGFSNWDNLGSMVTAFQADATALAATDFYATNQYYGTPAYPSGGTKRLWETEVSTLNDTFDATIGNAITWAKRTHTAIVDGLVSAWLYWWLLVPYDPADPTGNGDNQGLISKPATVSASGTRTIAKRFYGLGQWSKFVRPGWVRVSVSGGPSNTYVTAFRHPSSGAWAVVVINDSGSSQSFGLSLSGATPSSVTPYRTSSSENLTSLSALTPVGHRVSVTVAANSITTFTGTAS